MRDKLPEINQWRTYSPANPTRAEIARDILCAMVARGETIGAPARAVQLADELLAELGRRKAGKDETPAQDDSCPLCDKASCGCVPLNKWPNPLCAALHGATKLPPADFDAIRANLQIAANRMAGKPKPDPLVEELVEAAHQVWLRCDMPWDHWSADWRRFDNAIKAYQEARR